MAGPADWNTPGNWTLGVPDVNTPFSIVNGGIAVIVGFAAFGDSATIGGAALGAGELRIINGGSLTTVSTTFAPVIGSDFSGTVLIDAGTLNWTNTGRSETLRIGNSASGIGLMTITNGGSVSLNNNSSGDGTMTLGRFGGTATLNIGTGSSAGVLNAAFIGTNGSSGAQSVTGTINFNHSEADYFFTKDGTSTGTGVIVSQRIAVNQIGTGKTTLTSNNNYTGGTTISAGTLQIGNGGTTGSIAGDITNNAALIFNRSNDFTFSGIISGTGTVTKQGAGILTLTGANTYSGGTTINAGTLRIGDGGTTGSIAGNVENAAALVFNRSDDLLYSGVISGSGSVTKQGAGTLILSGNHAYSGDTFITEGTLQIGNGGASGILSGDIINSSELVFNRTGDYFYHFSVSGTGNFTLDGSILRLSNAQTYTGITTIRNNGILVLPFIDQSLSSSTRVNVESGSSLDISNSLLTLSGLTGGGTVYSFLGGNPAAGNLTLDIASGTSTFDGSFGGPFPNFSITKAGAGTQVLTGNSSHTGSTTVSGGSLIVNGNLGNSAVTVQNGGLLGGTGTLGGTLDLVFGYAPSNGDAFTLIDATSITGDFDSVNNPLGNALVYEASISDDYVFTVVAVQTNFATPIFTGNDPDLLTIATHMDQNFSDPGVLPTVNLLNSLPGASLPAAFQLINPDELAALNRITLAQARTHAFYLGSRLRELRSGVSGFSSAGFSLFDETGQQIRSSLIAGQTLPTGASSQAVGDADESKLSYFIKGSGTVLDIESEAFGPGIQDDSFSLLLGADARLAADLSLGLHGGYGRSDATLGGNGGDADVNSYRFGAQSTWWTPVREGRSETTQSLYTEAYFGLAYHDFDLRRASLGGDALGDTHGWQVDTGAALGYQIERAEWTFTPALALDYSRLRIDGYTESGFTPLQIDTSDTYSLSSTLSFRADYLLQVGKQELRPYAQIGWRHQYLDRSDSVAARFPGGNAGFFNVSGPRMSRDSLVSNLGLSTLLGEGLTAQLGYYGEHSSDFTVHSLNAALNFSF